MKPGYRPEIQGIRAVAALLVATFHLWLGRVSGGVDVFFIMSGFLVTTTLLGHYSRFGRIRPLYYLSRLGRRLLPAALTVLSVVAVLSWIILPKVAWERTAGEIIASTFYFENWRLAAESVDYLAQFDEKTPVQHFWAMSVQGQFYLIWLVLFLVIALFASTLVARRRAILTAFIVVAVLSFTWSVYSTSVNQPFAYFDTSARTWEFALGGIAAMVLPLISLPKLTRAILSWVGLVGIISCGLVLQVSTLFPGVAALWPTLSALCILLAGGAVSSRFSATRLLSTKPLVWLGDISYGVYLWHWPMLIVVLAITGAPEATLKTGSLILVGAIVLAWATNRFIENPIARNYPEKKPRPWLRPAVAGVVALALIGGTTAGTAVVEKSITAGVAQVNELLETPPTDPCWGAAALLAGEEECPISANVGQVIPNPVTQDSLSNAACDVTKDPEYPKLRPCAFGEPEATATKTVLLVGDSHSQSIRAAVDEMVTARGWHGIAIGHSGCIASQAERIYSTEGAAETCRAWNADLERWVEDHPGIDILMTMGASGRQVVTDDDTPWKVASAEGYLAEWSKFSSSIENVIVIRDTPKLKPSGPACVERSVTLGQNPATSCAVRKKSAVLFDGAVEAAENDDDPRTAVVDLTNGICDDTYCYPVVGGVWAYADSVHLIQLFSRTLGPYLGVQVDGIVASWTIE